MNSVFSNMRKAIVQLTSRCPYVCKSCLSKFDTIIPEKDEVRIDSVIKVLKDIFALEEKQTPEFWERLQVDITGGETLLRYRDASKLAFFCKESNVKSLLITSGFPIKKDQIAKFVDNFPITSLGISVESHDPAINDFVRGQGHLAHLMEIVPLIRNYTEQHNIKMNIFSLSLLTKLNMETKEKTIEFFKSIGFTESYFSSLRSIHHPLKLNMNNFVDKFYFDYSPETNEIRQFVPPTCIAKNWKTAVINKQGLLSPCWEFGQDKWIAIANKLVQNYPSLKRFDIRKYESLHDFYISADYLAINEYYNNNCHIECPRVYKNNFR